MEYFFNCLSEVDKKMQKVKNCVFMFDFDGTLSKINKTPKKASLKNSTRVLLKTLSKKFYVAVISGRSLSDIKNKVKLTNLIYAGNHGLEWEAEKEQGKIKINAKTSQKLFLAKKTFEKLILNYPGAFIEDKLFTLSVHYRLIDKRFNKIFLEESAKIISSIKKDNILLITRAKKAIEIRPKINWNKGVFVNFLVKYLEKKNDSSFFTFYIGDDKTDEDVFKVLKKGITVRMGKKQQSSARYFIKTNEINKLLSLLLKKYNKKSDC